MSSLSAEDVTPAKSANNWDMDLSTEPGRERVGTPLGPSGNHHPASSIFVGKEVGREAHILKMWFLI